ncbi:MAG: ribose-phosphate diphosphokinase [Gammaproteobacteria bacterium]|nr:ribose-phosphate diphosphokinase [Gammaproteobacteria bacterium]
MIILGFADYHDQAQALANALDVDYQEISLHRFPDGESLVRLPLPLPDHVVLCRSLDHPNDKLIEIILAAKTARDHGVKRVTLVAPYLCYMRQDIENQPGEAVSQQIIGQMLAEHFDDVITVDPHLHRIDRLEQAIPLNNAVALMATPVISDFLRQQDHHAMLFGPDGESEQWVSQLASELGFDWAVAHKVRHGDTDINITLPDKNFAGKDIYILDDMISTGHTVAQAAQLLFARQVRSVNVIVTHALFNQQAEPLLRDAGVNHIWSTDSIHHPSNRIALAPLLAQALRQLF